MKYMASFFIALAFVSFAVPSFANPTIDKFNDGFKDVVLSPLQVSDNVKEQTSDQKNLFPFALVGGFVKGSFYMGKQILTGMYHMATCPFFNDGK